jgi:hypothetical protein
MRRSKGRRFLFWGTTVLDRTNHEASKKTGKLRSVLLSACAKTGYSLTELTVLSVQVDPYRLDTDAGHRDGKWAATLLNRLYGSTTRSAHWRGLHYAIAIKGNIRKPNGEIYRNTDDDWIWLSEKAVKAARWLGYIPFERIVDRRNPDPLIYRRPRIDPVARILVGLDIEIPDLDDAEPRPLASGFVARQPFQFVIFGEKASLSEVVQPIAEEKEADLYIPIGEISDTLIYRIAKDADEDGRPLVVFTVSDCDPSGRQMIVSIARKLQAFRDLHFPNLRFEIVPAALTVKQVRDDLNLPSTPLKESEKRADRWRAAFGIEQTEVDALLTPEALSDGVLAELVERAFDPYFDRTLEARVRAAKDKWLRAAAKAIKKEIDKESLSEAREQAAELLDALRQKIDDINDLFREAVGNVVLPKINVPEDEIDDDAPRHALVSDDQDWVEATRTLIAHKSYGGDTE